MMTRCIVGIVTLAFMCPVGLASEQWEPGTEGRLSIKLKMALRGNKGIVSKLSFSPDGRLLAAQSGLTEPEVKIWSSDGGRMVKALEYGAGGGIAWRGDGKVFASAGEHFLALWDTDSWELISKDNVRYRDPLNKNIVFNPANDDEVFSASLELSPVITVWDLKASGGPRPEQIISGSDFLKTEGRARCIAVSPDKKLVAVGTEMNDDGTVKVFECDSHRLKATFGIGAPVKEISWSPDSGQLAAACNPSSSRGGFVVCSLEEGKRTLACFGHRDEVDTVVWSPSGKMIVTGGCDKRILFWDSTGGQEIGRIETKGIIEGDGFHSINQRVTALDMSADGRFLAAGFWEGDILVFECSRKEP